MNQSLKPMTTKEKKPILTCCLACGKKHDTKHKTCFGMWKDTCDICGHTGVMCASAPHDFGIYSNDKIRLDDQFQDTL